MVVFPKDWAMNSIKHFIRLGVFLLLLASGAITCVAGSSDPSGRVARLQYVVGEISVQPHGAGEWVQASVSRPLTNADNIWADKNSRAELNLGSARLRIDSETSLTLTNVNDMRAQVELHQGVLNVHVRRLGSGETYEIDTPSLAFLITKAGDYRIDVPKDEDSTIVTVRQGEGQATGNERAVSVHAGEQTEFGSSFLEHQIRKAPRQDGFDEWCQVREQRLDHASRYVSHSLVGGGDLDEYRAWRETLDYGPVHAPTTSPF
jgi:FecR protein